MSSVDGLAYALRPQIPEGNLTPRGRHAVIAGTLNQGAPTFQPVQQEFPASGASVPSCRGLLGAGWLFRHAVDSSLEHGSPPCCGDQGTGFLEADRSQQAAVTDHLGAVRTTVGLCRGDIRCPRASRARPICCPTPQFLIGSGTPEVCRRMFAAENEDMEQGIPAPLGLMTGTPCRTIRGQRYGSRPRQALIPVIPQGSRNCTVEHFPVPVE